MTSPHPTLSPLFLRGIDEFNRGQYYDCHETLEKVWMPETSSLKVFYQGIIQIAVGLYHLRASNYKGARSLLERGTAKVRPFSPVTQGIDVAGLVDATERCLAEMMVLGQEGMKAIDERVIPKITLVDPTS